MLKTKLFLFLALAGLSQAITINWGNGGGRGHMFVLNDGVTRVAAGSLIEVGFYATSTDPNSAFTLFGTTTMGHPGTGVNAIGGHIPGSGQSVVNNAANGTNTFEGKQLTLRVYNAATVAAASQVGIFTSSVWSTPGAGGFDDSADTFAFQVGVSAAPNNIGAVALDPELASPGSFTVGAVAVGAGSNAAGSIYRLGVIIPEPSSFTLAGVAALGLLLRRKRD